MAARLRGEAKAHARAKWKRCRRCFIFVVVYPHYIYIYNSEYSDFRFVVSECQVPFPPVFFLCSQTKNNNDVNPFCPPSRLPRPYDISISNTSTTPPASPSLPACDLKPTQVGGSCCQLSCYCPTLCSTVWPDQRRSTRYASR